MKYVKSNDNLTSIKEKEEGEIIFKGKTEAIYKVIVLGDPAVGKTELLTKFATNQFEERYLPTVGVSILKESIELKDCKATVNLMFWDIAGQPQFYMLHRPYFNGADGMLLVFDITRSSTFSNINNWYSSAVKYGLSNIPRILIGNKAHLAGDRKIILPMAEHLAEKLNAHYYETSSLSEYNVKEVFEKIAELVYRSKRLGGTGVSGKLIIKPYQGKTIEVPEKIQPFPKKNIESLVDPYFLWYLDKYGKLPGIYPHRHQIPGSYVPQTIISKKEKKKLAKEKKREQKVKTKREKSKKKIEKSEKREKLVEDMKLLLKISNKIIKEKQLEQSTKSQIKEERKPKLRIIPNAEEIEYDSNTPPPFMPTQLTHEEKSKSKPKRFLVCEQCGEILSSDSKFCHKCGTKIAREFSSPSKKPTVDIKRFEEHEEIGEMMIHDLDIKPGENTIKDIKSLIRIGKELVDVLKEGELGDIHLETSKGELIITKDEESNLIDLKRSRDRDDRDRFPYPYIFTHPRPPDDFATATQVQLRTPVKEKNYEAEIVCQYCGRKLTKEEQFTHSCKKKPEKK